MASQHKVVYVLFSINQNELETIDLQHVVCGCSFQNDSHSRLQKIRRDVLFYLPKVRDLKVTCKYECSKSWIFTSKIGDLKLESLEFVESLANQAYFIQIVGEFTKSICIRNSRLQSLKSLGLHKNALQQLELDSVDLIDK